MLKSTFALAFILTAVVRSSAGTPVVVESRETVKEESTFDRLWKIPVLYSSKENPYLQELRLTGRFHGDVYSIDSDAGHDSDWVVRRLRTGIKAKFLREFEAAVEVDLQVQGHPHPIYNRVTNAYVAWKPSEAFNLFVGKHDAKFTLEGWTSSNELLTIDRSNLANNFWFTEEYFSGVSVAGKVDEFQWRAGVYSGSSNEEFGDFEGGYFGVIGLGYDFAKSLGAKKALLRGDFVYNQPDTGSNGTKSFEEIASVSFQYVQEKWGVNADVTAGWGAFAQSDTWGAMVMPWYNITDDLQFVARYTYLESDASNGISLNRYERNLVGGKGDEYNEIYAGLNYYIYGHKLKLQTGLQYAWMADSSGGNDGDYAGWAWTTGFRFSF